MHAMHVYHVKQWCSLRGTSNIPSPSSWLASTPRSISYTSTGPAPTSLSFGSKTFEYYLCRKVGRQTGNSPTVPRLGVSSAGGLALWESVNVRRAPNTKLQKVSECIFFWMGRARKVPWYRCSPELMHARYIYYMPLCCTLACIATPYAAAALAAPPSPRGRSPLPLSLA
jgi:hypothetical protein